MLCKLEHVIIGCSEMKRSVAFYRDVLGFPVKRESAEWTEFHCGGVTLALRFTATSEAAQNQRQHGQERAGEAHLSFEVLDIEKFFQEKKERGAVFSVPPSTTNSRRKRAVLLDPDGLPISVTEEVR